VPPWYNLSRLEPCQIDLQCISCRLLAALSWETGGYMESISTYNPFGITTTTGRWRYYVGDWIIKSTRRCPQLLSACSSCLQQLSEAAFAASCLVVYAKMSTAAVHSSYPKQLSTAAVLFTIMRKADSSLTDLFFNYFSRPIIIIIFSRR